MIGDPVGRRTMGTFVRARFPQSDRGASAVEYGLLVAGIAAVVLVLVFTVGTTVRDALFGASCAALQAEVNGAPGDEDCD